MHNPYQTRKSRIVKIVDQAPAIKLFRFEFENKKNFRLDLEEGFWFQPGQFVILSLPGFGEAPFAPCNQRGSELELCIRAAGRLTKKLHTLKVGDKVGIRGPFGNGWPLASSQAELHIGMAPGSDAELRSATPKKNLLIVIGGLGLIPLRTLILGKNELLGKEAKMQIFYGARHPSEMLFRAEYESWRKNGIDLQLTIDKACPEWRGCVGLVTKLFDVVSLVPDAKAFLCGPPVMYKFVLEKLKEHQFEDKDIYLSLERRMHCGVGICQHCSIGPYYTCKDGPVFQYSKIKKVVGAI